MINRIWTWGNETAIRLFPSTTYWTWTIKHCWMLSWLFVSTFGDDVSLRSYPFSKLSVHETVKFIDIGYLSQFSVAHLLTAVKQRHSSCTGSASSMSLGTCNSKTTAHAVVPVTVLHLVETHQRTSEIWPQRKPFWATSFILLPNRKRYKVLQINKKQSPMIAWNYHRREKRQIGEMSADRMMDTTNF